jgi:glycosyltransferase involved in cell wall biosynthesis
MKTEQTFKSFGISNVKTIWPTYTRFLKKGAYSEFMKDKEGSDITSWEIPTDYVLSLITLEKGSHSYKIEQRALNFLKNVAIQVPNIDFIVIGASLKDVEKPTEFEHLKNFKLIGRIYDDSQMAELYRNAICVLCPIYIPGFSNRLFEAFFYGKVVISPYLVNEYYVGLQSGTNIIFTNDSITAAKIIKNIMLKDYVKKRIEEEARKYYLRNFSPKRHAEDLEQIIYHIVSGKDYVD